MLAMRSLAIRRNVFSEVEEMAVVQSVDEKNVTGICLGSVVSYVH